MKYRLKKEQDPIPESAKKNPPKHKLKEQRTKTKKCSKSNKLSHSNAV